MYFDSPSSFEHANIALYFFSFLANITKQNVLLYLYEAARTSAGEICAIGWQSNANGP